MLIFKKIFDLFLIFLSLPLTFPIYLLLILLVLYKFKFPILFKQPRAGLNGKVFNICKFRTMTNVFDKDGILLSDEVRLTRFGKFLRSTSLDELPSLWNVLKGDMSLVGPRPLLKEYVPHYSAREAKRHDVKPGITGWAQISYPYGTNDYDAEQKFMYDIYYIKNWTIWFWIC